MFWLLRIWDDRRMMACSVHEPPDAAADRIDRAENLEFVRDGFSFFAFLAPPVWMLANRMWLVLALYGAAIVLLCLGLIALTVPDPLVLFAALALNLWVGFEADALVRWSLERAGWTDLGTVTGRNQTECERAFFDNWLPSQPILSGSQQAGGTASRAPTFASPNALPPEFGVPRQSASDRTKPAGLIARTFGRAFGRSAS